MEQLTWFRRDLRAGDNAALAVLPAEERQDIPSLQDLGFEKPDPSALKMPAGSQGGRALLDDFQARMELYKETHDFPAVKGPSYLGIHLRFGTVSIRKLASTALAPRQKGSEGAATFVVKDLGIDGRWGERYFAEKLNDFDLCANNGG